MVSRHTRVMLAAIVIGLVFMADFLSKNWILTLQEQATRFPIPIFAGFNITIVWNHGISYGFMQTHDSLLSDFILAIMIFSILAIGAWLIQTKDKIMVFYLSLIIGGALGNLYDRLIFDAVLDFIDLYIGTWHWYVFNIADSMIVLGAIGIALNSSLKSNT